MFKCKFLLFRIDLSVDLKFFNDYKGYIFFQTLVTVTDEKKWIIVTINKVKRINFPIAEWWFAYSNVYNFL